MYYIKLSTSYLTRRVKVVGRGKKTFVDDKVLDQNVRSTFRAVAATWRLSILGRTPPGKLNVTWWFWNLKKEFNECVLKDKRKHVCIYQKRKKDKVKKIHGTDLLFSLKWYFFSCVWPSLPWQPGGRFSPVTGSTGHPAPRTVVNFGDFRDFCSWAFVVWSKIKHKQRW